MSASWRDEAVKALRRETDWLLGGDVGAYYTKAFSGRKALEPTHTHHPLSLSIDAVFPGIRLGQATFGSTSLAASASSPRPKISSSTSDSQSA